MDEPASAANGMLPMAGAAVTTASDKNTA